MKAFNGALTFLSFLLAGAMGTALGDRDGFEGKLWALSGFAIILGLGYWLASEDRDQLPEGDPRHFWGIPYVQFIGIMRPRNARLFCAATTAWVVAAGIRVLFHFYS